MLGLVTIGQSPREDIVTSMLGRVDVRLLGQAGALDGLSPAAITELAPRAGEHPLVTRLTGGGEAVIAKERITRLLNDAIRRVECGGATIICVLCTGEFVGLQSTRRVVFPDRILTGVVDAVALDGTLGIVMPHEGQLDGMTRRWSKTARSVVLKVVSPYQATGSFAGAASDLAAEGCEMIVLDCMGYSSAMQAQAQSAVKTPVLLANAVVGAVLASMVPGLARVAQDVVGV